MRPAAVVLSAIALGTAVLAAGCGGDDDGSDAPPPVARAEDFPKPGGGTLAEMRQSLGPGPVLAPSVSLLEPGKNRFGFGLFDRSRKQLADAQVALYVAEAGGGRVRGPFPARYESLSVKPAFQSESVTADPDAAESVYVAGVDFERPGNYELLGAVRLDDRVVASDPVAVQVVRDAPVPEVGERPPQIHTPTVADAGGVIAKIDTRVPPAPELHEVDFADVAGKKPVVLVFATPALCQSRVCGPVVDVERQVQVARGDEAAFIHMEIYRDNEIEKGFREQVLAWRLPTEPWAFTVDRQGKVAARLEGAFSAAELEKAVDAAVK